VLPVHDDVNVGGEQPVPKKLSMRFCSPSLSLKPSGVIAPVITMGTGRSGIIGAKVSRTVVGGKTVYEAHGTNY